MFLDISCIISSDDIIFFTSISTWKCSIDFIRTLCQVLVACNFPLFNIQYQKEKRKKKLAARGALFGLYEKIKPISIH